VLLLDDPEVLKKLELDKDDQKELAAVLNKNSATVKSILDVLKGSEWANTINNIKDIAGNNYVQGAVTVAGILVATWFAPAYYAAGMELLYPIVYDALWGIPSKWNITYWIIYLPGLQHAVAWAYNNSALITTLSVAATKLAINGIKLLNKSIGLIQNKLSSKIIIPTL
jgi:hypothetical protein